MTKQYTCIPLFIFKENNRSMVNWLHLVVVYPNGPFLEKGKISLTKLILQQGGTYSGLNLVLNIDMLIGSYNLEFYFTQTFGNVFIMRPGRRRKLERDAKTDKTSNGCTNRSTTGLILKPIQDKINAMNDGFK